MQLLGNRGRMGSNMAFLDSPSLCQPVEKKSKYKTQGTNVFFVGKEYHFLTTTSEHLIQNMFPRGANVLICFIEFLLKFDKLTTLFSCIF